MTSSCSYRLSPPPLPATPPVTGNGLVTVRIARTWFIFVVRAGVPGLGVSRAAILGRLGFATTLTRDGRLLCAEIELDIPFNIITCQPLVPLQ